MFVADAQTIEIIDIECGLLSRVSQKIISTKWRIYKGILFRQIGPCHVTERAFYI